MPPADGGASSGQERDDSKAHIGCDCRGGGDDPVRGRPGPWPVRRSRGRVAVSRSTRSARSRRRVASASRAGRPRLASAPCCAQQVQNPLGGVRRRGCRWARRPAPARGPCTSARAIATRCSCPPDRVTRGMRAAQVHPGRPALQHPADALGQRLPHRGLPCSSSGRATLSRHAPGAAARGRPGRQSRAWLRRKRGLLRARPATAMSRPSHQRMRPASHRVEPGDAVQQASTCPRRTRRGCATISPGCSVKVEALANTAVACA